MNKSIDFTKNPYHNFATSKRVAKPLVALTVAFFAIISPTRIPAAEWVLGLGADDMFDTIYREEAISGIVEYRSDPFYSTRFADFSWVAGGQFNTMQDLFIGAGGMVHFDLGNGPLFLEVGLAAGYAGFHKSAMKRGDSFQYKSSLAVGMDLASGDAFSIGLDHLMNDDFENHDPGTETLYFRYIRRH